MTVYENLNAVAKITIDNTSERNQKVNSLISKFELNPIRDISQFTQVDKRKMS